MSDRRAISPRNLLTLWRKYTTFQTGQLAPSTIKRDYRKVERRLEKMATADLNNAVAIRFITEGLRAGISVPDMSYLVRTSTTVLYKHYVDRTRAITVPEF